MAAMQFTGQCHGNWQNLTIAQFFLGRLLFKVGHLIKQDDLRS